MNHEHFKLPDFDTYLRTIARHVLLVLRSLLKMPTPHSRLNTLAVSRTDPDGGSAPFIEAMIAISEGADSTSSAGSHFK